jgi:hypothetical protein
MFLLSITSPSEKQSSKKKGFLVAIFCLQGKSVGDYFCLRGKNMSDYFFFCMFWFLLKI